MLGDYDVPVMYQDLGNYTPSYIMPGMIMPGMMPGMMPGTSYLGGVQLHQQPERDKIELMNKKDKDGKKTAILLAKIIGAALLIGYIPYFRKSINNAGGFKEYVKKGWNSLVAAIKGTTPPAPPKVSCWQKIKNFFKRTP